MAELVTNSEFITLGLPGKDLWWPNYLAVLEEEGIGTVSRSVIQADAEYIVEQGIFGDAEPGQETWPESQSRTGVVVGAVQSGKTASMMAVAAQLMDRGVEVIVILAGTQTSLWSQTYTRVREQLDTVEPAIRRRVLRPSSMRTGDDAPVELSTLYALTPAAVRKALKKNLPIVIVAMKQVDHLERVGRTLHNAVYPVAEELGKKLHLVVVDDEADDSSIDDSEVESAAEYGWRKQIPRRIVDLWESRDRPGTTVGDHIFANYVAYTATPQANFVQDTENPLSPRDFVVALRTPGRDGDPNVRTTTYKEPGGLDSWYTGGDFFYRDLKSISPCVVQDETEPDEAFIDSLRAYLVATAVRLWREPTRLGPLTARAKVFASKTEAKSSVMSPASMLVHPSATMNSHFELAERIWSWSWADDSPTRSFEEASARCLGTKGIEADMVRNEDKWLGWLESYTESGKGLKQDLGVSTDRIYPGSDKWEELRASILGEVAPGTQIAVVNSDPNADDRPRFSPVADAEGWDPAPNLSTIFVAGNVMSRGLTLEGLTTTVFTRSSATPAADTQIQMQRWFGFRGSIIDLCRVFLTEDQLDLFGTYHEQDQALRRDILGGMREGKHAPDVTVLQGRNFQATAKVTNVRGVELSPGHKPFLKYMNREGQDVGNLDLVQTLFDVPESERISDFRGLLLREPRSLVDTATILEQLRYEEHKPDPNGPEASRWTSLERHLGLESGDPSLPLYRPPHSESHCTETTLGLKSPYFLGAYLRLWEASLDRRVDGLLTTDEVPRRWNSLDLDMLREQQPRFWIGLRFGSGDPISKGPAAKLGLQVRPLKREHAGNWLGSEWGARNRVNGTIQGDEVFDYMLRDLPPALDVNDLRRRGSDGLLLFHIIDRGDGVGSVVFGMGIPVGGPDQVRAVRHPK